MRNIKLIIKGPTGKLLKEAKELAEAERVTVMTSIEQGEAYERIVDIADTENCDIIVMGRRGINHIERMLMGSVTSRVIGYTNKDVLVMPRDATIGWSNILLATDSSKYSKAAAEHAINFAASYGSDLTAVSVVDVTDEFYAQAPEAVEQMVEKAKNTLKEVKKKAEDANIKTETFVKEGEVYRKIIELAKEKKTNIIFMGSHGKKGLKKLLMGSVTERVIGLTACAVLVVKQ